MEGESQSMSDYKPQPWQEHNPNCDGDHCTSTTSETRLLPIGSNPHHGNLILCHACFCYELQWRRERNKELAKECAFRLPQWESLTVVHANTPQN